MLQDAGITVLIGGHMTHPRYLVSEGGYLADSSPEDVYWNAALHGVKDFVVPGNKVDFVEKYRKLIERQLEPGSFSLYAPGFISQGGEVSEYAQAAGDRWHAIVGRAIVNAENIAEAAEKITANIK